MDEEKTDEKQSLNLEIVNRLIQEAETGLGPVVLDQEGQVIDDAGIQAAREAASLVSNSDQLQTSLSSIVKAHGMVKEVGQTALIELAEKIDPIINQLSTPEAVLAFQAAQEHVDEARTEVTQNLIAANDYMMEHFSDSAFLAAQRAIGEQLGDTAFVEAQKAIGEQLLTTKERLIPQIFDFYEAASDSLERAYQVANYDFEPPTRLFEVVEENAVLQGRVGLTPSALNYNALTNGFSEDFYGTINDYGRNRIEPGVGLYDSPPFEIDEIEPDDPPSGGKLVLEFRAKVGNANQLGNVLDDEFRAGIFPVCHLRRHANTNYWHIDLFDGTEEEAKDYIYRIRDAEEPDFDLLFEWQERTNSIGYVYVSDWPIIPVKVFIFNETQIDMIEDLSAAVMEKLKFAGFEIESPPGREIEDTSEPLTQLEQGIIEVISELRKDLKRITNGIIASELFNRRIYNEREGESYTEATISRAKSNLRKKGFDV